MPKRPYPLTAVCILGALASLYALVLLLSPGVWAVRPSSGQRAAGVAAIAVGLASLYGLWRMRRWGVMVLAAALAVRLVYGALEGLPWSWAGLVGPVAVLAVALAYVRRMS